MTGSPAAAPVLTHTPAGGALPHACAWRYDGRAAATDPRRADVVCDDPTLLSCRVRGCGRSVVAKCQTTRARRCVPCGAAYRGRVGVLAGSGLVLGRQGLFLTLTAPGGRAHTMPDGSRCRCTPVGGTDLPAWNASAGERFNRVIKELRRELGSDVVGWDESGAPVELGAQYFKAAEVQRRGALHFHLLLRRASGAPVAVSVAAFRRLAIRHGFGHAVDVQRLQPGHAAYVAKYVSKSADDRSDVPWRGLRWTGGHDRVSKLTGELVHVPRGQVVATAPTFRTWSSSRSWGRSMAAVRAAQAHYAATVAVLPSWEARWTSPAWASLAGCVRSPERAPPDG